MRAVFPSSRSLCLLVPVLAALLLTGCRRLPAPPAPGETAALPTLAGGHAPDGWLVVTHGGAGSPPAWTPHTQAAADSAAAVLRDRPGTPALATALDAALAGTMAMENDPLFNAGTGANIRLDGRTIQMDAALMTGDGEFASVAVIERVRHPILVARAVLDTPHRMLAGDGATRFAHRIGFPDVVPTCPEALRKYRRRIARLLRGEAGGGYAEFDWRACWNYPGPPPTPADTLAWADDPETGDTVATVVRDAGGHFAVTISTGGTSLTLDGRVGDVPIYGCGCYAGPAGAVACTGFGEEIIRHQMARTIYTLLADGLPAREAVRRACAAFPREYSLGLIAVGRDGWGVAANRQMAWGQAGAS